jgi:GT2 family glycosyltransferase
MAAVVTDCSTRQPSARHKSQLRFPARHRVDPHLAQGAKAPSLRRAPSASPLLSVVIPNYNGLPVLRLCLRALARYLPDGAEVIVEFVERTHPWVRLVRLASNRGFCAAVNAGIQQARGAIVQTLNNDAVVTPGWADAPLRAFADPSVGSVAPLVWRLGVPGLLDSAGLTYHIGGYGTNRGSCCWPHPRYLRRREIFGATASAAFFRREALLRVGGFPEEFVAYYDDVDLAFRLRWAGYRCLFEPASQVLHCGSYSHNLRAPNLVRQYALNEERTFWANLPSHLLPMALPLHLLYFGGTTDLYGLLWLRSRL